MTIVFATHNSHKVDEVRALLDPALVLLTLADIGFHEDPPETSDTFEGNAVQKAEFVYQRTGHICVADDSGLSVDALDGAPGVYSKRFSPECTAYANNHLLLMRMRGIDQRTARFTCVVAVVGPRGVSTVMESCTGRIGRDLQGTSGFGYDPLFWPDETPGRTMAELTMAEKNQISHRGRAFRHLPALLASL